MDHKKKQRRSDLWSSSTNEIRHEMFSSYDSPQQRENSSLSDYDVMIKKQLESAPSSSDQIKLLGQEDHQTNDNQDRSKPQFWDPKTMLSNLSIMEQKIHQLQDLVRLIVGRTDESTSGLFVQQQQLVTADLTSIIIQLISTAGSLLPSVKHPRFGKDNFQEDNHNNDGDKNVVSKVEDQSNETDHMDVHEEDDVDDGENLPPGSYEILQLEKEEILAPHTHFCVVCGKGFKRDANLRMHMRGHGDEYKTPAALAKPHKETGLEPKLIKRYSCPFVGCKRNKDHKKFQPLKTILCVKNHYKRTHCDKSYTCSRCNAKKFSVIADLKTHEKHCGRDRWLCSCGTTFSRKDKLFGHIALFQGHTPAIPFDEPKNVPIDAHDKGGEGQAAKDVGCLDFNAFNGTDEPSVCFSPMNMDPCGLNGFQELPRTLFEDSDTSFSFLFSGSCNYPWKNAGESGSNDVQ